MTTLPKFQNYGLAYYPDNTSKKFEAHSDLLRYHRQDPQLRKPREPPHGPTTERSELHGTNIVRMDVQA